MNQPSEGPPVDPRRWAPHGDWTPEGHLEAASRMPPFASQFFARLTATFPSLEGEAVFLRWSAQPDDVYAYFARPPGFVIQIDPHLEYIAVLAGSGTGEYGDRGDNDRIQEALDHVRSLLEPGP